VAFHSSSFSLFRALAARPFALLWGGQTVSRLGDAVFDIALAWWVLEETGSAAAMGSVLIFGAIPELLFLLVGGVAVDRVSRLGLMLTSDLVRAGAAGLMAGLAWEDALTLPVVFAVSAIFGLVSAFFYPAYTAAIPEILPTEALTSANSLRSLSLHLTGLIGPAIGAAVVASIGTAFAFALDAVSFAMAAGSLLGIARLPALRRGVARETGVLTDLREGFATVLGMPWLWVTIAVAGISNLTIAGPFYACLPLLVSERLGDDVRVLALLSGAVAAGSIAAAVVLGGRTRLRRRGWLTYGAWLLLALAVAVLGLPIAVAGAVVAVLIYGATETILGLVWTNTLQELVPRERLGRVASIDALGSAALLPVGYGLAGIAADRVGAAPVFLVGGLVGALVIAAGLLHPGVRGVD
jgi:DHA3 family tetracycline resistance protein-like MFS transporter